MEDIRRKSWQRVSPKTQKGTKRTHKRGKRKKERKCSCVRLKNESEGTIEIELKLRLQTMWKREMKKTKTKSIQKSESFKWFGRERWNGVLLQRRTRRRKIKKQAEKQKKGEKKNTLEREEKQPDGMTVNPFSSIWKERKWKKENVMNNKQLFHMLIAGVQTHRSNETLSVSKSDWSTIWMSSTTRTKLPFIVPFTKTLHSIAQCLCVITGHKRRSEQEKKEKQKHDWNREKTIEKTLLKKMHFWNKNNSVIQKHNEKWKTISKSCEKKHNDWNKQNYKSCTKWCETSKYISNNYNSE